MSKRFYEAVIYIFPAVKTPIGRLIESFKSSDWIIEKIKKDFPDVYDKFKLLGGWLPFYGFQEQGREAYPFLALGDDVEYKHFILHD